MIRSTRAAAAVVLAGGLLAGGFSTIAGAHSAAHAAACPTTKLTSTSSGKSITLKPCDLIRITLSQSSDGGYLWYVTKKPSAVLKLVSDKTVQPRHAPGQVGGNTTRVFTYKAVAKGSTTLTLEEYRSFAKSSVVGTFKLAVKVM